MSLPGKRRIPAPLVARLVMSGLLAAGGASATQAADFQDVPMVRDGSAAPTPWKRYSNWPKTGWENYNTLADPKRSPPPPREGDFRPVATPIEGDPVKGMLLAFSRDRGGGCVACHVMGPKTPELPGNIGPDLSEIGAAGRDDAHLFNQIYDPRIFNPTSVMIPWGAHGYYTEAEIKDMVAFLKTLREPAVFRNSLDDPHQRPVPVEDRDHLDPFINPAADAIDAGNELFRKPGPNGKACVSCHEGPENRFKRWAVTMPKWDVAMGKVIGVEEFVTRHAAATTGDRFLMQSPQNTQLSVYLRTLGNGEPIAVDVANPGAKEAAERGARLMEVKVGQGNFACIDCHTVEKGANKWIRGQWLGESPGQLPHFPVWRTSRNETWDIRKRLQWCNVQIRADELPPDAPEYGELELYLTAISNGMPMEAPGIRH
jgi:sulfur-oxidizing protein SoxA